MSPRSLALPVFLAALSVLGCETSRVNAPAAPAAPPPATSITETVFSVGSCDSAVVASVGGIVRTTDGGHTWSTTDGTNVRAFASIGSTMFSAANGAVLTSPDAGLHWSRVPATMLPNATFWSFAVVADRIFVNGTFLGVYRSTDLGATWQTANNGLPGNAQVGRIAATNGVLVALIGTEVYRSSDGGDSWAHLSALPTQYPYGFAAGHGSFYITDAFGPVYVSRDNGDTWSRTAADLPPAIHPYKAVVLGAALYVISAEGLYRTVDDGASWQQMAVGGHTYTIANDVALHDGSLYVATDGIGVQRSDDDGATWTRVHPTGGLP